MTRPSAPGPAAHEDNRVRQAQAITALLAAPAARLHPRPAGLGVEPLALRRAAPTDPPHT
jgi:hypothetical protein